MKLLIVTGIFPPDVGGPASYVPRIAAALAERGHQVVGVITLSDRLDHDDRNYPFPVLRLLRGQPTWRRLFSVITKIRRMARSADVVYLNGLVFEGVIACRWLDRRAVVIKVVGDLIWERARNQRAFSGTLDEFQRAALPVKWRLLRRLQAWYTARADAVVCPSAYLAGIVRGWRVPHDQVRVVYNAVRPTQSAPTAAPDHDLVTVVRLVPWKGIAELIQVAGEQGWSLRIVGDGPLRQELQGLAARCTRSDAVITFTGHVPGAQVEHEIRRARVFVLNSSYEGLPHIVLEAKVAGVPVIATAAGGTPEAVGAPQSGVLVPVGDRAALTQAIAELLSNSDARERLVSASHAQLNETFSFAGMVRATECVLQECLRT